MPGLIQDDRSPLDDLPDAMTASARRFISAYSDLLDFVFFISKVVMAQEHARQAAGNALLAAAAVEEQEKIQAALGYSTREELRSYAPVIYETLMSRGVDNYLVYISDLLGEVFVARPEMLRSSEQVRVDFVLSYETRQELIEALADRRVERLSYAGVRDTASDLQRSLSFDLFPSRSDLDRAVRIIENRNLIVHNRAVVNHTYVRRVPETPFSIGERLQLDIDTVFGELDFLARAALDADARAALKWGLPTAPYLPSR